jgi:hypothetical protein
MPFTEKCAVFDSPAVFCWRLRKRHPSAVSGLFMHPLRVFLAVAILAALAVKAGAASPIACSNGWCRLPISQPRRMRCCFGRPETARFGWL